MFRAGGHNDGRPYLRYEDLYIAEDLLGNKSLVSAGLKMKGYIAVPGSTRSNIQRFSFGQAFLLAQSYSATDCLLISLDMGQQLRAGLFSPETLCIEDFDGLVKMGNGLFDFR